MTQVTALISLFSEALQKITSIEANLSHISGTRIGSTESSDNKIGGVLAVSAGDVQQIVIDCVANQQLLQQENPTAVIENVPETVGDLEMV